MTFVALFAITDPIFIGYRTVTIKAFFLFKAFDLMLA
jgi:hypothetical protein